MLQRPKDDPPLGSAAPAWVAYFVRQSCSTPVDSCVRFSFPLSDAVLAKRKLEVLAPPVSLETPAIFRDFFSDESMVG